MDIPKLLKRSGVAITPVSWQVSLFETTPASHPDMIIDSIGVSIMGNDLSQILSCYLIYFVSNDSTSEVIFPLSFAYRPSTQPTEVITVTHRLNCFCAENTGVFFGVEWKGSNLPPGLQAQVDLVATYYD
jgi:hypothetical protein